MQKAINMKTTSRLQQNQRIGPLDPRSRSDRTHVKMAKSNTSSPVGRKRSAGARAGAKTLVPATRTAALPVLATPPRHILVPIDFSKESIRALKSAAELAGRYAAAVTLVHVVEPMFYIHDVGYGPVRRQRFDEGVMRHARQRLHVLGRRHIDRALDCEAVIKCGRAFEQIVKAAEELKADLIIMPTRGFAHNESGEIGSTAERVVRHAPCPVLTLRKPVR